MPNYHNLTAFPSSSNSNGPKVFNRAPGLRQLFVRLQHIINLKDHLQRNLHFYWAQAQ